MADSDPSDVRRTDSLVVDTLRKGFHLRQRILTAEVRPRRRRVRAAEKEKGEEEDPIGNVDQLAIVRVGRIITRRSLVRQDRRTGAPFLSPPENDRLPCWLGDVNY